MRMRKMVTCRASSPMLRGVLCKEVVYDDDDDDDDDDDERPDETAVFCNSGFSVER